MEPGWSGAGVVVPDAEGVVTPGVAAPGVVVPGASAAPDPPGSTPSASWVVPPGESSPPIVNSAPATTSTVRTPTADHTTARELRPATRARARASALPPREPAVAGPGAPSGAGCDRATGGVASPSAGGWKKIEVARSRTFEKRPRRGAAGGTIPAAGVVAGCRGAVAGSRALADE